MIEKAQIEIKQKLNELRQKDLSRGVSNFLLKENTLKRNREIQKEINKLFENN